VGRHRTAEEKVALGEQARAMRAEGLSRREIMAELHIGDDLISELLAGTAVPASLRRRKAKDHLRARARELREAGWTYPKIAKELSISTSSCSLWLRDMDHPEPSLEGQARRTAGIRASSARTQQLRDVERELTKQLAAESLGEITSRDLVLALAVSYWCEGAKDKPWARREHLRWMNSDPVLARLFLEGLRLLDVSDEQLRIRLTIHESADEQAALRWWSEQLSWPVERFQRTTFKRHNPKTIRKNTGGTYHGCIVITVVQSRELYRALDGLVRGLAHQPRASDVGGSMGVRSDVA
jgi:predicted transcriptional regulator